MAKTSDPDLTLTRAEADLLDDLFAATRAAPPALPDGLQARMAADALAAMPVAPPMSDLTRPVVRSAVRPSAKRGMLAGLIATLGGWQAMGGLTTALVLGFGIGVAPPAVVESLATDLLGGSAVEQIEDVLWSFDSSLLEG